MARTGAERVHVRNRFGVRAPLHRHDVTTQVANGYILERASRENGAGKKKEEEFKIVVLSLSGAGWVCTETDPRETCFLNLPWLVAPQALSNILTVFKLGGPQKFHK